MQSLKNDRRMRPASGVPTLRECDECFRVGGHKSWCDKGK